MMIDKARSSGIPDSDFLVRDCCQLGVLDDQFDVVTTTHVIQVGTRMLFFFRLSGGGGRGRRRRGDLAVGLWGLHEITTLITAQ